MGDKARTLPHPDEDWPHFLEILKRHNGLEPAVFDPISGGHKPWIDIAKLREIYGHKTTTTACAIC